MDSYFSLLNLSFVENCHISIFTTFAKQSMINRLSNAINRNRSAAKISKVMSSSGDYQHQLPQVATWVAGWPKPQPFKSRHTDAEKLVGEINLVKYGHFGLNLLSQGLLLSCEF